METMSELTADWTNLLMETQPIVLLSIVLSEVESSLGCGDLNTEIALNGFSRADWLECLGILLRTLEKHHALFSGLNKYYIWI
jgi:hypothetical protein